MSQWAEVAHAGAVELFVFTRARMVADDLEEFIRPDCAFVAHVMPTDGLAPFALNFLRFTNVGKRPTKADLTKLTIGERDGGRGSRR